jgi:nicotinate-nucleotide pyrophosphorylase (carboxylating)
LYDAILLKDNHVDFAGSMGEALKRTKAYMDEKQWDLPVIVEVRHLDDIRICLAHPWINRLLLDNMTPEMVQKAVALIDGAFETEVSGSVDEHNIADYAAQGVDYVSIGALTHQIKSLDMSMTVKKSAL